MVIMNTGHQPVIANDQPLDAIRWDFPLPPHRISVCPSTFIIGLAHQNLLSYIHSVLIGETVVQNSNWFTNHVNEAILRGLIFSRCDTIYHPSYPTTLEEFEVVLRLRDGWNWIPASRHK